MLKEILKLRKQDKDERDEQETLLDLYLRAMDAPSPARSPRPPDQQPLPPGPIHRARCAMGPEFEAAERLLEDSARCRLIEPWTTRTITAR